MIHQLQYGDLAAQLVEQEGKLHTDDAAADDGHGAGHMIQVQGLGAGDQVVLPLLGDEGGHEHLGAGGDDDILGGDFLPARRQGVGVQEAGGALHHGDLVAPEQALYAIDQSFDHSGLALLQCLHVHGDSIGLHALNGKFGGLLHRGIALGGLDQRLGGDTPHVQAGAAEVGVLDDTGPFAQLGGLDGGLIAAGAGADDGHIVVVSAPGCGRLLRRGRSLGGLGCRGDGGNGGILAVCGGQGGVGVLAGLAHHGDGGEHVGVLPLVEQDFEHGAVLGGLHGHGGLVGVDLKEHLALFHRVPHTLVPLDQLPLVHVEAQLGHDDNFCHVCLSSRFLTSGSGWGFPAAASYTPQTGRPAGRR